MNYFAKHISFIAIMGLFIPIPSLGGQIGYTDNSYSPGQTLTASDLNAKFNEIKAEVNDNDSRITINSGAITTNANAISNNASAISNKGLHGVTVLSPPACQSIASTTTVYQKIADMGTFSKLSDTSTVEIQFNGRLAVLSMTGTGVKFELRVDDTATTNGRARSIVKAAEAGGDGVHSSINGIFTNLLAGNHTVSMWAQSSSGTTGAVYWDPGCWSSDHVVIKEME